MNKKTYIFDAKIHCIPEKGGAYVIFPWNIKDEFGKGRVKVRAFFDGVVYDGSIVNMGIKDVTGGICYIIGIRKDIRKLIQKDCGDTVHVQVMERE